jgi:hypothetical protein
MKGGNGSIKNEEELKKVGIIDQMYFGRLMME